jgi:hypothetical protein
MEGPKSTQQSSVDQQEAPRLVNSRIRELRRMQWFFLVILSLWTIAAFVLPVVVFYLTRNLLSLLLLLALIPPLSLLYRIIKPLFSVSEDHELQARKMLLDGTREIWQRPGTRSVRAPISSNLLLLVGVVAFNLVIILLVREESILLPIAVLGTAFISISLYYFREKDV